MKDKEHRDDWAGQKSLDKLARERERERRRAETEKVEKLNRQLREEKHKLRFQVERLRLLEENPELSEPELSARARDELYLKERQEREERRKRNELDGDPEQVNRLSRYKSSCCRSQLVWVGGVPDTAWICVECGTEYAAYTGCYDVVEHSASELEEAGVGAQKLERALAEKSSPKPELPQRVILSQIQAMSAGNQYGARTEMIAWDQYGRAWVSGVVSNELTGDVDVTPWLRADPLDFPLDDGGEP